MGDKKAERKKKVKTRKREKGIQESRERDKEDAKTERERQ